MSKAFAQPKPFDFREIQRVRERISAVVTTTPLHENLQYSNLYQCKVQLKREDLQVVRSYKIRGAYNKIIQNKHYKKFVCASAGNHAQGVAYSCHKLGLNATIFMPNNTPAQKIEQVKMFGQDSITVRLIGETFDETEVHAKDYAKKSSGLYIPPFDDWDIIQGQATIAIEILESSNSPIDYLFVPIGGGGLASGISSVFKQISPHTKIVGVEPQGAESMQAAFNQGQTIKLDTINKFVDGAAVQKVGEIPYSICKHTLDQVISVDEGLICQTILNLYNKDAIVVEPAGALSLAALEQFKHEIVDKNVVCIMSGSNNDINRIEEIREKALLYNGKKHYFLVRFQQQAGSLKHFIDHVLGSGSDITYFQYQKKHNRSHGPAIVGIELDSIEKLQPLILRMKQENFYGDYLNNNPELFSLVM